jgi:putative ABC transport system substrate-binding protein
MDGRAALGFLARGSIMQFGRLKRREFITLLGGATMVWPKLAAAQLLARRPLVAMLVAGSAKGYSRHVQAFSRGMQELGYTEGRNLEIIYRYADGDPARLPTLAAELVKLNPNVIVTTNTSAALAAKQATTIIPIVSTVLTDPIGNGRRDDQQSQQN